LGRNGLIRACDWSMLFAFAFARNPFTHFVVNHPSEAQQVSGKGEGWAFPAVGVLPRGNFVVVGHLPALNVDVAHQCLTLVPFAISAEAVWFFTQRHIIKGAQDELEINRF
jgi:hypothetical protein